MAAEDPSSAILADPAAKAPGDPTIVVISPRLFGQVETPAKPIITLEPEDIESFGADSIGDLLDALGPETGSGRGRGDGHPVILLNGQRISNFRQLREIPPDAIRRLEVLPEEVAVKFGYPPDQRVVNFILKDKYSALTAQGGASVPSRGGNSDSKVEGGLVRFHGPGRLTIKGKVEAVSMLTEDERGIVQPAGSTPTVAGDPDPAANRSLVPRSITGKLNGSWSTGLGEKGFDGSLTLDGEINHTDSRSLSGLNMVLLTAPDGSSAVRTLPGALTSHVTTDNFQGGVTLNKPLGAWHLNATIDSAYTNTITYTDRRASLAYLQAAAAAGLVAIDGPLTLPAGAGSDRAQNRLLTVSANAVLSGSVLTLPAGEVSLTVNLGEDHLDNRASSVNAAGSASASLARDILTAGVDLSIPLTGGRDGFADALGAFTLNLSDEVHRFSDFGTLNDWNVGLVWSPVPRLSLTSSYISSRIAPSVGQLGNPQTVSLAVPVFDFARNETVLVSRTSGGNPVLRAEQDRDVKVSANYDLPFLDRSRLVVEYFRNTSDNVASAFPLLTPDVEAAFPGRVTRDATGRLVAIDGRPVNIASVETQNLRWGFSLMGRIGRASRDGGRDGGHRAGGPRGGGPPGGGPPHRRGGGRWNVSVYHTWRFAARTTIAPGQDALDQLAGYSLSSGGTPRHSVEMEGGGYYKGVGLRLKGTWMAPARVLASGAPASSDLRFGSVTKLDLRLFVNFDQRPGVIRAAPFLKGARLSLYVNNLLDSRQRVTDAGGLVPLAYQPGYLDPDGRVIGINLSKKF